MNTDLFGLLGGGDPQTTGAVPAGMSPVAQAVSAPAGTYGYGVDPEAQAYAQAGIDPAVIEQARWRHLGDLGMAAMIAGAPGVTADTAIGYMRGLDPNQGVKDVITAKKYATDAALDRAKLNLAQQELLSRQRAEAREQALNEALGLSISPSTAAPAPAQTIPTIAQAAGLSPINPGVQAAVADLPGQNGNPPLDVTGTGGGQPVDPVQAAPRQQIAQVAPQQLAPQAPLSPVQQQIAAPLSPMATARGVFAGDPAVLGRLGISPEQAAMLRITAATGPEGRQKAISEIMSISQKPRYQSEANDAGYLVQTDQYGNKSVVQAPTQAQTLALEQGKSDIQEVREIGAETRKNAFERQKAAEDSRRAEEVKARETAMGVANKGVEEAFKSAQASKDVLEKTNIAEDLMRQGVFSGGAAAVTVGAAQATLSRYGLWSNEMAEDTQARTVALQNLGKQIALGIAKSLRPTTDKDMEVAQRIAGLAPEQYDERTIREVLRISRAGHEKTITDYNTAADRARKPFEMAGDARSRAAADAAYPKLEVPARPQAPTSAPQMGASPQATRTIGGVTYAHDGRGWYRVGQ